MRDTRIYRYAYLMALQVWAKEKKILEKDPESEIAKHRERKYWEDVEEIGRLYAEVEKRCDERREK